MAPLDLEVLRHDRRCRSSSRPRLAGGAPAAGHRSGSRSLRCGHRTPINPAKKRTWVVPTLTWRRDPGPPEGGPPNGGSTMPDRSTSFPVVREAVASFPGPRAFSPRGPALLAAGFEPSDLSVLACHEPLDAAEESRATSPGRAQRRDQVHRAADRRRDRADLGRAGCRDRRGAGRRRAGRRRDEGAVRRLHCAAAQRGFRSCAAMPARHCLWVRCADSELELRALRVLEEAGGQHVHMHGHPAQTDPA